MSQLRPVLTFDGVNDYIEIPYSEKHNPKVFTLSCWVNPSKLGEIGIIGTHYRKARVDEGYVISMSHGNRWYLDITKGQYVTSPSAPTLNMWTHVATTFDGKKAKLYLNGRAASELIVSSHTVNTHVPLHIGAAHYSETNVPYAFFTGQIAEVCIWNKARTEQEIQSDMHQSLSGKEEGLVGYWPLDEGSGTTAIDKTGNGKNGVIKGAIWKEGGLFDATDVMIKDGPSDTGVEPYRGANFWSFSDIVVRTTDDGVFLPDNAAQSGIVERGQPNYIYVRVTNRGPQDARNVTVTTRITPAVGLQFVYPQDWTLLDKTHVSPQPITANFASIPAGGTAIAKFRIETAQTETLYGWTNGTRWHPCLLAMVNADNDYAFANAQLTNDRPSARFNNLAQRNLSVVDKQPPGLVPRFAFIAGNQHDAQPKMSIKIDRSGLPKDMPLELALDDDGSAFPLVNFETQPTNDNEQQNDDGDDNGLVFLERTRVSVRLGGCRGVLTLEKGSRFDCLKVNKLGKVTVKGGELIVRDDKRYVEVKESAVTVEVEKSPNGIYPLSVQTTIPATAKKGDEFPIHVEQQNTEGTTVGGASVVYQVG